MRRKKKRQHVITISKSKKAGEQGNNNTVKLDGVTI